LIICSDIILNLCLPLTARCFDVRLVDIVGPYLQYLIFFLTFKWVQLV